MSKHGPVRQLVERLNDAWMDVTDIEYNEAVDFVGRRNAVRAEADALDAGRNADEPITEAALERAGCECIVWNGVSPGWWHTLTPDNADRLEGPHLEVRFNERLDRPPTEFTAYIADRTWKKKAMGVRTMRDLRTLHRLLTGRELAEVNSE